jgi:N-acetylglucosamine-6-phosphate deacetylase
MDGVVNKDASMKKQKTARRLIKNGRVLLSGSEAANTSVLIENGAIAGLGLTAPGAEEIDASGGFVAPGFIDLHTHGIGYESTAGCLRKYSALAAEKGTTTFFPTLFGPPEQSAGHMHRHLEETDHFRLTPQIVGFRLESPYLAYTGAGISKDLAPISKATTALLLKAARNRVCIWDISPDLPGALETIRELTRAGIVCSMAHTRAALETARAAVDAGTRLVTHLFDTFMVPAMTDPGVYPVSLVDYLLVEDRVACEIIPDGTHVHPLLVEKTLRCKPADKIVFVTDSNFGAGLEPGDYDLPQDWGRARIAGPNEGVRLIDREMGLAGSALTPIDAFRNAVRLFGQSMGTASRLCSLNPARLLGLNKGEIAVGRDADLVVLNAALELQYTLVAGEVVYAAASRRQR